MEKCDLLVIGGGSGGVRAARLAAASGASVIVAESGALGGTCVNVGCVPKKLFVYASAFSDEMKTAKSFGWQNARLGAMNWQTLVDNKNREIARLNAVYGELLKNAAVRLIKKRAMIIGENQVQAGDETFFADKVLLATGAHPLRPPIDGAALSVLSDDMFFLPALPRRAAVIGGGYIALEFACILAGLGVETAICYRADLPIRGFDDDLRAHLAAEIAKRGVAIHAGSAPTKLAMAPTGIVLSFADGHFVESDLVLSATGRKPSLSDLGLEKINLAPNQNGALEVNDDYQTECPWIYAIGDLLTTPALTPVATAEAGVFVNRVFNNDKNATVDYANLPTAIFSQPALATVGLSESKAAATGISPLVYRARFRAMKKGFAGGEEETFMKLVVHPQNNKVLGAHLIGEDAAEIIQGLAIAIRMGATKADFDATVGVHPTSAEEFVTMRATD